MEFACKNCKSKYDQLSRMNKVQASEGLYLYYCPDCESDEEITEVRYPTD